MSVTSRRLFLAGALTFAGLGPCVGQGGEVLRVGIYPDNQPWEFRNAGGELVGFDIDLMETIGTRLGMRISFVAMPFRELFPALEQGRIDAAICSITITAERVQNFDFSQAYYRTSQGIVVMRSSGIRSLRGLKGRKISVEPGTTNEEWVTRNTPVHDFGPVVHSSGIENGLGLLQSGKADAYFGDLPALLYQLLNRRDLAVIERLPTNDNYAVMLPKGSALTDKIDRAIAGIKEDGVLAGIHRKWFGSLPEPGSPSLVPLPRP